MVLYIGIAAGWFLLAFVALAICRVASLTEDAQSRELADWIAAGAPSASEEPVAEDAAAPSLPDRRRASSASG
ncbi:MAG TPA: hypothetical protein VGH09_00630 [Solirubrobacteraceae bacterium]